MVSWTITHSQSRLIFLWSLAMFSSLLSLMKSLRMMQAVEIHNVFQRTLSSAQTLITSFRFSWMNLPTLTSLNLRLRISETRRVCVLVKASRTYVFALKILSWLVRKSILMRIVSKIRRLLLWQPTDWSRTLSWQGKQPHTRLSSNLRTRSPLLALSS